MTTQVEDTTVRSEIVVDATADRAFRLFTERFDRIKPREDNLLAVDIAESVFEPRAGGRVYDRGVDGSECQWGRVLAFEPPERLVFSWDINPMWQLESDHVKTSEVEVRFIADGPTRTKVELEHRHLDRHGDGWEGMRAGVDGDQGWPLYFGRFAAPTSRGTARRSPRPAHARGHGWTATHSFHCSVVRRRSRHRATASGDPVTVESLNSSSHLATIARWRADHVRPRREASSSSGRASAAPG